MRTVAALLIPLAPLACGCQVIFGVERISRVEEPNQACTVPTEREAALRVGNLLATDQTIDLCLARGGSHEYQRTALIDHFGAGCPDVGYKQITVPLPVEPGTYDLKAVATGETCADAGLATFTGVTVEAGETHTALLMGGGDQEPELRAFIDRPGESAVTLLRFINAMVGPDALDLGTVDSTSLGSLAVVQNVTFGRYTTETDSPISTTGVVGGYVAMRSNLSRLGVAASGTTELLASVPIDSFTPANSYSLYGIGVEGSEVYPPALWSCSDTELEPDQVHGLFAPCGDPRDLEVDVFNTNLTDIFTPYITERRAPILAAIRNLKSDVVCLNEVYDPADMTAILAEAAQNEYLPYAVTSAELVASGSYDSVLTPLDGPEPTYETPACGAEHAADLDAMLAAVEAECTVERDGGHHFRSPGEVASDCMTDAVVSNDVLDLLAGDLAAKTCWMCALTNLAGDRSTEETRTRCTEGVEREDRFIYDGSVGLVVLSRFPIAEPFLRILPATDWARGVIRAPLDVGNGVTLDFYCTSLNVVDDQTTLPYTGYYGNGETLAAGGLAEQQLEVQRIIDFVTERTPASGRAILAGTFYAGPAAEGSDGTELVQAENAQLYELLAGTYSPLVAASYEPACTVCVDNPAGGTHVSGAARTWTTHLFGRGVFQHDVLKTERTFTEPVIPVTDANDEAIEIPLSQHYGLRSTIRIAQ